MNITFLGTGTSQGVPFIGCTCRVCLSENVKDNRLRSSVHIDVDGLSIVVDTGPDFRQQMLRAKIETLDHILYTHSHKDHLAGLDDIRAYNYWQERPVDIHCTTLTLRQLQSEFGYIFAEDKYPGIPDVDVHLFENNTFHLGNTTVTPIRTLHYNMEVFGFRIHDFVYITDANFIAVEELEKMRGCKVLVLNALRRQPHISHFNLAEAIEIAEEIKAEQTYFTHISHQLGMHDEVERELPKNIHLAYDGLQVNL